MRSLLAGRFEARVAWLTGIACALLAGLCSYDAAGHESLRLGQTTLAPLPAWALALGVLAVAPAFARARALPALALLAASLVGLAVLDADRHAHAPLDALAASVTRASDPATPEERLTLSLAELASAPRLTARVGRREDVALRAEGWLTLSEAGLQRVTASCQGSCEVALDGRVVARAEGLAPVVAQVSLDAGAHALRLQLRQPGARARLALDWDGPAHVEWLPLGARVGLVPLDPIALRAQSRRVAARVVAGALLRFLAAFSLAVCLAGLPAAARAGGPALRAWCAQPLHRQALAAGATATLFLGALHLWARPHLLPNGRLHAWSSEYMMQTVTAADLRAEPLRSLVYLHIQPPAFDALRALLVALHPRLDGAALLLAVDQGLYVAWALAYGAAVALVFAWIARAHGARAGGVASALFALHPAVIFYATFLDTTFVSALGVAWLTYELTRAARAEGSAARLGSALIALLLTRSIVQWPFVLVAGASLLLLGVARPVARRALGAFALATALFVGKQYLLFGLTITSSFGPDSFCKGLSQFCLGTTPVALPELPAPGAAWVLRRTAKLDGEYNYNQLAFLRRSFAQMAEYRDLLRATPPARLGALMAVNARIWLRPSTSHSAHALVDRLPWRAAFDRAWSGAGLLALLGLASLSWAVRARAAPGGLRRGLGLALPCLYVASVSIVFESGENMRYKFFVEPVLVVFVCAEACALLARARRGPAQ